LEQEEAGRTYHTLNGVIRITDLLAVFGMSDSLLGEIEFADVEGVLATRAGFISHQAVVQVTYDSSRLSCCSLVRFALQRNLAYTIYYRSNEERVAARIEVERVKEISSIAGHISGTIQPTLDTKQFLRPTALKFVPLTDLQAMKWNRLIAAGVLNVATHLLSPRQGFDELNEKFNPTGHQSDD
jgi:hypothetical protein